MRKVITSWEELTAFIKANKDKKYSLIPISIYGPINQKKEINEVRTIQSITLEVIEQ